MTKLKDKIEDKVEDIIYKKAKEEIEYTIKSYLKMIGKKIYSFMGWEETQEQKIDRLSKEIQEKKDVLLDDGTVGMIELFTMNYVNAIGTILGVDIVDESEIESEVDSEKKAVAEDSDNEKTSEKEAVAEDSENEKTSEKEKESKKEE